MPLMPFQRFCVVTPVAPRDVATRLATAVAPRPLIWFASAVTDLPFQGWVRGSDFLILRVPHERRENRGGKNMKSFVPRVRGRITPAPGGSRLEGTMMVEPIVLVFCLFWTGGMSWGVISLVYEALHSGRWRWYDLSGLVGMLLGVTALWLHSFSQEIRKTHDLLAKVLDGDSPRPAP
jgi:hypothetical protein